ncbi:MAG: extracellular solute-binding protein [Candidatus Paceibacterota bacterium]
MSRKKIITFSLVIIILISLSYFFLISQKNSTGQGDQKPTGPTEVTLEFWGVWDNSDSWQKIIDDFEKETHNWNGQEVKVKINYTKKDIAGYEDSINQTYLEGKSPNIFTINNYWLEKYAEKLEPLSGNTAYTEEYGLLDYEELSEIFPQNILRDALNKDNEMLALPVYSDSLALYYNKDLFQKAGIENPPTTWDELKADAKKLTILGRNKTITQSAISLGGGKNINRSCDILSLLTFQGGGKMIDSQGNVDLNRQVSIKTSEGTVEREPGLTAVQFYMDFSDPQKEIYTWNDEVGDSLKSFAEGKTAMMFGYSYQKASLLVLKPELNYGIAPVPQLPNSTPMNVANVWMPVVSNQNSCEIIGEDAVNIDCAKIAWSFLSFANQKENISQYLDITNKASARADLIQEQSEKDDNVTAFARQAEITHSYEKFDDQIDFILSDMLEGIYSDRDNWKTKTDAAVAKIEELKNNTNQ